MGNEDLAFFEGQRDQFVVVAQIATDYANANPGDKEAQDVANLAGEGLQSCRRTVDRLRYDA